MRPRDVLSVLAMLAMAVCIPYLLWTSVSEPVRDSGPNGRQYATVDIDGCQYIQRAYDGHIVHKGNCRNPIHWERVLQDTSWWRTVRPIEDSKLEIHTPKGKRHGKEDQGL